ncbi:MAG: Lrp/AsnC family transcriptional regulator, partial [Candidatus Puniceispirillaceae bacterium]
MKDLDASIIALLKSNARMSVTQMSQELGASRVTINSHIRKMEQSGIITGYTVTLGAEEFRHEEFRHKVSGWVMITVDASKEEAVIDELAGMPQIARLFTTNGRWDLAAEIQTSTL